LRRKTGKNPILDQVTPVAKRFRHFPGGRPKTAFGEMIDTVNIPTNILPDIKHTPFSTPVLKMNPFPPLKKKGKSLLFVGMPR
jgi:hypothetical protein